MKDEYYTVDEVAEITKMKIKTIRRYCREGRIPAVKFGSHYRITKATMLAIADGEVRLEKTDG